VQLRHTRSVLISLGAVLVLVIACRLLADNSEISAKFSPYPIPPRATFAGLHIGMTADSATIVFKNKAKRMQKNHVDSLDLIESDSIVIYGQPAYVQAQILQGKIRTLVINFHPLAGERYLNVRDLVDNYMQRLFGRGVEETDESMTHHRWETIEGTMEVTHSDKYTRVFIRLGKPRA